MINKTEYIFTNRQGYKEFFGRTINFKNPIILIKHNITTNRINAIKTFKTLKDAKIYGKKLK